MLLIIGLVSAASGALVHVAATAVENVVKLAHAFVLCSISSVAAAFDTARLATLPHSFVQRSAIWPLSSLILAASSLGRRRLCLKAPPAYAGRLVKTGTEVHSTK